MRIEEEVLEAQIKAELEKDKPVEAVTEEATTEVTEEKTYTELEVEQMEKGWDPNKEDGVSAKEFKRVGEIIEAKRKASKEAQVKSKEVEELTQTVKQLVEHNKSIAKAAYEKAQKDLALQKMEKIQEGE